MVSVSTMICGALVAKSCLTLATPWTVDHQAPLSMNFCRQGYWSGLPFPFPGYLPDPGIEPGSPALQADSLPAELPGKPHYKRTSKYNTRERHSGSFTYKVLWTKTREEIFFFLPSRSKNTSQINEISLGRGKIYRLTSERLRE